MYASCLFCSGSLGRNESLEHFPVGRRLAFDAAKGRLWVVCPSCARWNLTPLEVRWEAIEEAERAYRETKLRVATEHIGLARLKEGTELVRIGQPLLPEFAAWRYGEVFRKRWKRVAAYSAACVAVPLAVSAYRLFGLNGAAMYGAGASLSYSAFQVLHSANLTWQSRRPRTSIMTDEGERLLISRQGAAGSRAFWPHGSTALELELEYIKMLPTGLVLRTLGLKRRQRFTGASTSMSGDVAHRVLTTLLPLVNHGGASAKQVSHAVNFALDKRELGEMLKGFRYPDGRGGDWTGISQIGRMPGPMRLAMEMITQEANERRALEGEMHELEMRWREAEEIAGIADGMFVPELVHERLNRLREH